MTSFVPSPSQSDIQVALQAFLQAILPAGTEIVEGQDSRVPEPQGPNFVVMTTIRRERIETNIDHYADCAFTAAINGDMMAVTAMGIGTLTIGNTLFGTGVAPGTSITRQVDGTPGGIGTYTVAPNQTVGAETMACGAQTFLQPTKVTVQLDVHSADVSTAADMAQTISTLFRDAYAASFFADLGVGVAPLYADDPRQMPFINAEAQFETRYIVEAVLQANQVVSAPLQFADVVTIGLIDVDVVYPAT